MELSKMKKTIKIILVVLLFVASPMLMAEKAKWKSVNELLDVSLFEKTMEESTNMAVKVMKEVNPEMRNYEGIVRSFYNKYFSADIIRKDIFEMYSEIFTEKEIKDITAFYKTTTGKKSLEKIPEIMDRSMQIAQKRLLQHKDELEKLLEKAMLEKEQVVK
jgi:hypothetical protein